MSLGKYSEVLKFALKKIIFTDYDCLSSESPLTFHMSKGIFSKKFVLPQEI